MPEPTKATASRGDVAVLPMNANPKVLELHVGEGGVSLPGHSVYNRLKGTMGPGATVLHMELSRSLGGVTIRYAHMGKPTCVLVPMAHIRSLVLEE